MIQKATLLATCAILVAPVYLDDSKDITYSIFDYGLYEEVLDSNRCREQIQNMRTAEFYDVSFRLPQGILGGHTTSMGNFYQCLGIEQNSVKGPIEGKYCMIIADGEELNKFPILSGTSWLNDTKWIEVHYNETIKDLRKNGWDLTIGDPLGPLNKRIEEFPVFDFYEFSLAICIPKTCTVEDALSPIQDNPTLEFDYSVDFCRLPHDKPVVAADYIAIMVFSTIGILTISSTAYDFRQRFLFKKGPAEFSTVLRCCSVYTNTKALLTFKSAPGAIDCIDGIRSISITWIIIGHLVISTYLSKYTVNIIEFLDWGQSRKNIWLVSSELSVDTFFALSGLLLVYTAVKKMTQIQLMKNLHLFYLNRLLRIFPLLACAVLLQASAFHRVADGVDWHYMGYFVQMCREYWWSALLHIQNIVNPADHCIPQTWYLSVDVQLHILSPLLLFWLLGSRRAAWSGLALGVGAVITTSTAFIFSKDFSEGFDYDVYYYKNTLTRCPPFLVGMVFGYLLHIYRGKKLKLSFLFVAFGYILALAVSSYCMYTFNATWDNQFVNNFNRAFVRGAWSVCVCWLIFACAHGYGGPINWFLSLKIWKFMARISYPMYLFHYAIIFTLGSSKVTPRYFTLGNIFLEFASVMVYTVVASVAAVVLIDAPCVTLQKIVLNALTSPSSKTTAEPAQAPLPESIALHINTN